MLQGFGLGEPHGSDRSMTHDTSSLDVPKLFPSASPITAGIGGGEC